MKWLSVCLLLAFVTPAQAQLANIKVVTDANPDYSDMESLVHSSTANWKSDQEKMWALFYWNHIARRYTYAPMYFHGAELTDPIRNFNDFGYAYRYTAVGLECSIWNYMGYPCRCFGSCADVFYQGKYHAYDGCYSCIYTLADGKTIASAEDLGKPGAGPETGGKTVPGYLVRFHALNGTSPDGFLEGYPGVLSLAQRAEDFVGNIPFNAFIQDRGHRYILNLHDGESYVRYYARQDTRTPHAVAWQIDQPYKSDPAYFIPNGLDELGNPADPEIIPAACRIRANGERNFTPILDEAHFPCAFYSASNIKAINGTGAAPASGGGGLQPIASNRPAVAIFKVEGANIITSARIRALFALASAGDSASIAVSSTNGNQWQELWHSAKTDRGEVSQDLRLIQEVNGCYDFLVKVSLFAKAQPENARLDSIAFDAITQLNSKTQPQLHIGANTVYVGLGDQSHSIVLDPDLHGHHYAPFLFEEKNIRVCPDDLSLNGQGVLFPQNPADPAYVVFKVDCPSDITAFTYGGRLANRNSKGHIDFLHSFDAGKTWVKDYSLATAPSPSDTIHFESLRDVPPGNRSVLFKDVLSATREDPGGTSLYSVHMEVDHRLMAPAKLPLEVTFRWRESQKDYSFVSRSHTQFIDKFPTTYTINVGGADHPIVDSLTVSLQGADNAPPAGYSDGNDAAPAAAERWIGKWATYGRNLALHKPYTLSSPPGDWWGSGSDLHHTILTDGIVGSARSWGDGFPPAVAWDANKHLEITVDLGAVQKCAAFRIHTLGWEPWEPVKGQTLDKIEVLVSSDGKNFKSAGFFDCKLRWKDLPVNFTVPDDEFIGGYNHTLVPAAPLEARYIKYKTDTVRIFAVTEVQVLDAISFAPFDLKIALPDPATNGKPPPNADLSPNAKKWGPKDLPQIGQPSKP